MKILVVDDDKSISAFLKSHLSRSGFVVDTAESGEQGTGLCRINEYDVVILDLNLPDMNGEEVCKKIRLNRHVPPILMLSVVSDAPSKTRLLNAGADDYMVKPFLFDELVARIRALLRRSNDVISDVLTAGDLELDTVGQTARRGKRDLKLTRKEFGLLEYIMRHAGATVSKVALIEHVWSSDADAFSEAIETHMSNLRKKIGNPALIHTVHGRGYRID